MQDVRWRLDDSDQVKLIPDLVWYPEARGGPPGLVVDAKYKAEKVSGFPNPDVYQLLAYCTSLGSTADTLSMRPETSQERPTGFPVLV